MGRRQCDDLLLFCISQQQLLHSYLQITTSNTRSKEATVIGTLRASGYTKRELIRHYMTMPVIVMLAGGSSRKYTGLYCTERLYGCHVLRQLQSADLCDYMECRCVYQNNIGSDSDSNVDQLRDLAQQAVDVTAQIYAERSQQTKKKKIVHLSSRIHFVTRFRFRIIFQNVPNYITIFVGVFFCQSDPVIRLDVQSALSSL